MALRAFILGRLAAIILLSSFFYLLSSFVFRLLHQLKHFLVLAAHAVAGAEYFFFVEGIRL